MESQFKYCPIVWMFYSRHTNSQINRVHERDLRIGYNDGISNFDQLIDMENFFSIHDQNIQRLKRCTFRSETIFWQMKAL